MPSVNTRKPLLVSEARARFSELVEQVMEQPGTAVHIGHRGRKGSVVLVDALHYQLLVERARVAEQTWGNHFRLAGSMEVLVSDEELEAGIAEDRRAQAELAAAKFNDL
jgi:prevent-host-death family protein